MNKYVIEYGYDGESGKLLGYAEDMHHALSQVERILGGRESAMRIPVIRRGDLSDGIYMFCFVSERRSMWIKAYPEYRKSIEKVRAFDDVEPHKDYSIFV